MTLSYCYLINSLQRTPIKKKKKSIIIFYLLANQTLEADTKKRPPPPTAPQRRSKPGPSPPEHIETVHVSHSVEECGQGGGAGY